MSTAAIQQREIRQRIADQLRHIPEVDTAYVGEEDGAMAVWVVLDRFDRAVFDKIYPLEEQMWDLYPDSNVIIHMIGKLPGHRARDMITVSETLYERTPQ